VASQAAALVERGFDHTPVARPVGSGLELEHFGLQQDRVEQVVDARAVLAEFDHLRIATEIFRNDFLGEQFVLDPQRIGVGLVDLVDRTISGTARLPCYGFARLPIMPSSAATTSTTISVSLAPRTHLRERRVAGVSRKLMTPLGVSTVRADVLGDAPAPEATLVRRM
jgi:hypothetical protein